MARTSGSGAASAADAAPPSSGATTVTRIMEPLPRLHYCCFMGTRGQFRARWAAKETARKR